MIRNCWLIIYTVFPLMATGQSANAPLNPDYYHLIDRLEILNGKFSPFFQNTIRPYRRESIGRFMDSLVLMDANPGRVDRFNRKYLSIDNWEWARSVEDHESNKAFLKHFYQTKSDFFHVHTNSFDMHLNPVIHLGAGTESGGDATPYINTRGLQVRGMVDNKVGFYSYIGENQAVYPQYVRDWIDDYNVIPHEGFWKDFKKYGVDYFHARGYVSFNATDHINLQFGHDRFFIGNGYRSLFMSDFGPPYTFLKIQTRVWKINYTNYFTERRADAFNTSGTSPGDGFPGKYVTSHHLAINLTENFNIGLFETIAFGVDGLEISYLNPVIFYRAIEQQNGSKDNVIIGADLNWLPGSHFLFYGQFSLDEFLLEQVRAGDGWWGNKYGLQLGGKYIEVFGIPNLDLQAEWNSIRPYTYSHQNIFNNYAHYRQPIAHPLGANFNEIIAGIRYQPLERLNLWGKFIYASYGADTAGTNWGKNILLNNRTREQDFNNTIGQGVPVDLYYINLGATFQIKHNFFVDIQQVFRTAKSELPSLNDQTSYTSAGLRLNIRQRNHEF